MAARAPLVEPVIPAELEAAMWMPNGVPRRTPGLTFWAYLTAARLPIPRPPKMKDGVEVSTAMHRMKDLRAVFRLAGIDSPKRDALAEPWLDHETPWDKIYHAIKTAGFEHHEHTRKALVPYAWFEGLAGDKMPRFLHGKWNTVKAVRKAKAEGRIVERERFLDLPRELEAMLGKRPHADHVHPHMRRGWEMRAARHNDQTFRTIIAAGPYLGPRASEWATLRLEQIDFERCTIEGWEQPKKHGKPRTVVLPKGERFVFTGDPRIFPSLKAYAEGSRAEVAQKEYRDEGPFFLTDEGKPYKLTTYGSTIAPFISEAMKRCLGPDAPGPHALRRACATLRYAAGWDLDGRDGVALFLDDEASTVEKSYLDWTWIKQQQGAQRPKDAGPRPALKMIRSKGERALAAGMNPEKRNAEK